MESHAQLKSYLKQKALSQGALLFGTTKIRRVEPVIVLGFPFTAKWFLKNPLRVAGMLSREYAASKHVQDCLATILHRCGYSAHYKTIWSLYGDFRPIAVAAGLGEWGRNGIVVNKNHGSGLLFAAVFTNAPLAADTQQNHGLESHCTTCEQCIAACPGHAFDQHGFHAHRCLPNCLKGCTACITACRGNNR